MPILDEATADALAERLFRAERERRAVPQLSAEHPDMDAVDAYRVQQAVVRRRMERGATIVGWKLGLTSRAMQQQLGVDQPDYGPILSDYLVPEGTPIPVAQLVQPRVEAEIAFVLRTSLRGPGVTAGDALAAAAGISPAVEIIDSRIEQWRLTLVDTISDLASSARVTVGSRLVPIEGFDQRLIGCALERGGEVVATGAGAAALGDPAAAVAWAANTLGPLGVTLEAGHVIMTGALHASVPVAAGDVFTARFDRIGSVTVRFS